MLINTCPRCKAWAQFNILWSSRAWWSQGVELKDAALLCTACRSPVAGLVDGEEQNILRLWPDFVTGKDFPDVPNHIAEAADEAYRCHSIKAYRAALMLARSVIEATAKEKGITDGKLYEKIDEMYNRRLIREDVKEAAHEVRHFGNDVAHGDFVAPVREGDAQLILTLMSEVLDEVFQSPARVQRARERREKKATEPDSEQMSSTDHRPSP